MTARIKKSLSFLERYRRNFTVHQKGLKLVNQASGWSTGRYDPAGSREWREITPDQIRKQIAINCSRPEGELNHRSESMERRLLAAIAELPVEAFNTARP